MKRIALALVIALTVLVGGPVAASQAEDCASLPPVAGAPTPPAECLTPEMAAYIYNLQTSFTIQQEQTAYFRGQADMLSGQVEALSAERYVLTAQVQRVTAERDAALAVAQARLGRILTLRAKIKELRQIIRG